MPLVEKFVRAFILGCLVALCAPASAFMPASGVWVIEAEENGKPGRGFQLDVENETIIFYYNGYRADGSSVFYVAFGPIEGNGFVAPLREYRGGTVMGGERKDAAEMPSPGNLNITFTSGTRGSITFPGEPAKAATKFNFGHPKNADGLLGTFMLAYPTKAGVIGDKFTLTRKLNASSVGNGVVANADASMACENITKIPLAGAIVCTEVSAQPNNDDYYVFRMAGNRGTGVGTWASASLEYPLEVWRTATARGTTTGLNEGNSTSVEKLNEASSVGDHSQLRELRKSAASEQATEYLLSIDERAQLKEWARQASAMLRGER